MPLAEHPTTGHLDLDTFLTDDRRIIEQAIRKSIPVERHAFWTDRLDHITQEHRQQDEERYEAIRGSFGTTQQQHYTYNDLNESADALHSTIQQLLDQQRQLEQNAERTLPDAVAKYIVIRDTRKFTENRVRDLTGRYNRVRRHFRGLNAA